MTTERQFEWDANKAAQNLKKHSVAFEEAATVFDDPMFITVVDDEHSVDEERYITIGLSAQGRLLMIAHTDRGGQMRIISARKATKKEEQFYAEAE
ncbi:MAG: BrnT family toxin [Anaerolineales bacterium]|nr:BrnT family toxin [Anaerolineales bacterium]